MATRTAKRPRVDVNLDELDGIVESARKQPISEDDAKKLTDALHSMAHLLQ